ncbi:UNVERIFIED_CONTAM: hypothetical protein RMT77_018602 [Armadillidium vulgare]
MGWDAAIVLQQDICTKRNLPTKLVQAQGFFGTIHQHLSETGYLQSTEDTNAGRPRSTRTVYLEELVLNEISEHPEKSTRELSLQFNSNQSSIWRLLYEQQLHPYHVQQVHTLLPRDYAPRVVICQWFLDKCIDPNFLSKVLFTDKAHFTRTAIVNVHNEHIVPIVPKKPCAWTSLVGRFLLVQMSCCRTIAASHPIH